MCDPFLFFQLVRAFPAFRDMTKVDGERKI